MTSQGHFIFSLSCAIFLKKIEFFRTLNLGEWGHVISGCICTCLLPDIDHPSSFLGKKLSWISVPISKTFGHRGFTHSLFACLCLYIMIFSIPFVRNFFPLDFSCALLVGYFSHILADFLTPLGVPIFWPLNIRFCIPILSANNLKREKKLCMLFLFVSILYPFSEFYSFKNFIDFQLIKDIIKNIYNLFIDF
ncbi:putative inner membrane protein [Wigglesworthia glossinidia endosymbiont of Glossina morsitans morsitans (Yale colony)]|uniref:Putative inner membrane protein n=1 Tax=Wigglesworthia glossinidia endosymbiont of Glossina morsitans morsitans (Yale colony) TaxID=1142511 RepID=H6Q4E7_WIGGL|nr:metal-dependent hydrolase [Wigglesworthia glossinidia]AFA41007.1 putative inner membrane protein [Wigglesworthia glossinidia endosymbiont of Glossina morsitans morsitans (Yale colony)]